MKKFFKFVTMVLFGICLVFNSCSEENVTLKPNEESIFKSKFSQEDYSIPTVNEVESLAEDSVEVMKLKTFLTFVGDYDLDLTNVELIKTVEYESVKMFSIPFMESSTRKLIVTEESNYLKVLIADNVQLKNGNNVYSVFNYDNELLFRLEQNQENMFGNIEINEFDNGYFIFDFNNSGGGNLTTKASCLRFNSFNNCMNCAWKQCSSNWVCGAVLAVKPVEALTFAVAMCGLNTIVNLI